MRVKIVFTPPHGRDGEYSQVLPIKVYFIHIHIFNPSDNMLSAIQPILFGCSGATFEVVLR